MLNTATLLRRTANRLDRVGWQRRSMGDRSGPNCVVGAMLWEADPECGPGSFGARRLAEEACGELLAFLDGAQRCPVPGCNCGNLGGPTAVMAWNDMTVRDQREVTVALRACADKLDREAALGRVRADVMAYVPPVWVKAQLKPTVSLGDLAKALVPA